VTDKENPISAYQPVNRIGKYANKSTEIVEEHPMSTTVLAFGLGIATGLAVMTLLSGSGSRRRIDNIAHHLGQQFLDAMSSVIPDAMSRTFRT
jgi:hypothetical protein